MQASSSYFSRLAAKSALPALLASFILLATSMAQFSNPRPLVDTSTLKPPPGARVAIIEFEDMECPQCARANPLLRDASANYHAPWIRHDFPLPQHTWSHQAAINARWFDTKSKKLGDEYRDEVFANQINIENIDGLRAFTEKFAKEHGNLAMPFAVDPQGKLDELVMADLTMAQRMGINQTPTIYIVTNNPSVQPVHVEDLSKLYTTLDQAFAETKPAAKPALKPVKH